MHAILLQENQVSALPDLNKTFKGCIVELAEDRLCPCDQGIPLSNHN